MIRCKTAEEVPNSATARQSRLLAGNGSCERLKDNEKKGVPGREKPAHKGWRVPGTHRDLRALSSQIMKSLSP